MHSPGDVPDLQRQDLRRQDLRRQDLRRQDLRRQDLRRQDLRLVPAAVLAWLTAVITALLPPVPVLALAAALFAGAAAVAFHPLVTPRCLHRYRGGMRSRKPDRPGRKQPIGKAGRSSLAATMGLAFLLSSAVAVHSFVGALERNHGPVAEAVDAGRSVVAEVTVAGFPRPLENSVPSAAAGPRDSTASMAGEEASRWSVSVEIVSLATDGRRLSSGASLLVMGGREWSTLVPGDRVRVVGKLRETRSGQAEVGRLSATTSPKILGRTQQPGTGPAELREAFRLAASDLEGDAAGLLPGMVTGDTSGLDESLEQAMKTVGMTHLTAVSGANCSLVLGCLVGIARGMRFPRPAAAAAALAGLSWFVLMVGPDPSVLRAAVMGAIGAAALSGGRRGRTFGFLCLSVIALLIADPLLGLSIGFLLSVAATLGIVTLGSRLNGWLQSWMPAWLSTALAVPMAAQVFCSPVIVALQPGFSPYALIANVAAAPFVAPVTVAGTLAVPLVGVAPWAADGLLVVAGTATGVVASLARFSAALPGSTLPWPEGPVGVVTMVLCSIMTIAVLWMVTHPRTVIEAVFAVHSRVVDCLISFDRRRT